MKREPTYDTEFKTLIIRMLTEMAEYGRKIEEKMKAMQTDIKQNVQGNNSEGKETGTQINNVEQKEEINILPEQNEETRIKKNDREEDGSEIGGSRVTSPFPWVKHLAYLLRNRANSQHSRVYED